MFKKWWLVYDGPKNEWSVVRIVTLFGKRYGYEKQFATGPFTELTDCLDELCAILIDEDYS